MASYDSSKVNQPGQYPAGAWTQYGLPVQDEDSGAAGGPPPSSENDKGPGGATNEPGQYPSRVPFAGTAIDGTGAPGTAGVPGGSAASGPDSVTFQKDVAWKSQFQPDGMVEGQAPQHTSGTVSGKGDWTQANSQGYQAGAQFQMPGTAQVQLDAGGSGHFQPGAGSVRRGGNMNGQR